MYFLLLDPVNQYVNYLPGYLKEQEFVINYMDCSWKVCHKSAQPHGNLFSFFFSHTFTSVLTQNPNPNEIGKSRWRAKLRGQNLFSISELRFKMWSLWHSLSVRSPDLLAQSSVTSLLIFLFLHPFEDKTKLLLWWSLKISFNSNSRTSCPGGIHLGTVPLFNRFSYFCRENMPYRERRQVFRNCLVA